MENKIVKQFQDIISFYEKVIGESELLYQVLLERNVTEVDSLNKKTMMMGFELKQKIEAMKKEVEKQCVLHQIEDKNLTNLFPYCSTEEVEKMMACRETAFHFEKKLKNITKMIKCKSIAYIETSQVVKELYCG